MELQVNFKGWLKCEKNNEYRARCTSCNVSFLSELSKIKKHAVSVGYIKNVKSTLSSSQNFMLKQFLNKKDDTFDQQIKIAELKSSLFFVEHNIPFLTMDHLEGVLKVNFPDSKICQEMKLKRMKTTNIIKNVVASIEKESIANKLNNTKFSVMIDESTDIGSETTMCVVVR